MKKYAFTLAEILITLTILGLIGVITIPVLFHKNIERINKVKIRKALSAYENSINKIVVENNLPHTVQALNDFINNNGDCSNAYNYFKVAETNNCQFKTSDGLWFDVSEISRTLVSFKEENLTYDKAYDIRFNEAFVFVTDFDTNSSLRVNDFGYANTVGDPYLVSVEEVINYLNDEKFPFYPPYCENNIYKSCTRKYYGDGTKLSYWIYDENGNIIVNRTICDTNERNCRYIQFKEYKGNETYIKYGCDKYGQNCNYSDVEVNENGKIVAMKRVCRGEGENQKCSAYEFYKYDGNSRIATKNNCNKDGQNCKSCSGTGCYQTSDGFWDYE